MNIEKQLDEFYSMLDIFPISSNAISLYLILMQIIKKANWKENIRIANSILTSKTKLSISALQRARNELITNGFIKYKKRYKSK